MALNNGIKGAIIFIVGTFVFAFTLPMIIYVQKLDRLSTYVCDSFYFLKFLVWLKCSYFKFI